MMTSQNLSRDLNRLYIALNGTEELRQQLVETVSRELDAEWLAELEKLTSSPPRVP